MVRLSYVRVHAVEGGVVKGVGRGWEGGEVLRTELCPSLHRSLRGSQKL